MLMLLKMQLHNLRLRHTCHSAPVSAVYLTSESQNPIAFSAAKAKWVFVTLFQESLCLVHAEMLYQCGSKPWEG